MNILKLYKLNMSHGWKIREIHFGNVIYYQVLKLCKYVGVK